MRIVVTGGAGFVGVRVASALAERGDSVAIVDSLVALSSRAHQEAAIAALVARGAEIHVAKDIITDDLQAAVEGADAVIHLAAIPGVGASWADLFRHYSATNIVGSQRLMEAMTAAAPGARLVLASSSSIYGDQDTMPIAESATPAPRSPYGVSKLAAEQLAAAYRRVSGLDVVCARLFTVCGPGQRGDMAIARMIASARGGPDFVATDMTWTRDYTHVDDVAAALIALTDAPHLTDHAYNIAGANRASLVDVARLVTAAVGAPPTIHGGGAGRGDPRHTWADTSAAARDIGWFPVLTLEDAIGHQVADPDGLATSPSATRPAA